MVYKEHFLELHINGYKVDLESQKSLNLRFQNVLYDPEKIASNQAEYSFEFELPSTPNNDKIFDYANNLSRLNKFHSRWNAEVYADGTLIFEGSLTLNGYKNKMYNCNLVSVKVYSLEEIFGDAVLTDIPWEIPFDGAGPASSGYTIDYYNSQLDGNVVFPLVSYGVFQKSPKSQDSVGKNYTSKFDLDKYNRWYVESFYPSLNMIETMRKAFEFKGYTVAGDAFKNVYLKDIFMSCNLADEQSPDYNLGNPKFGKVDLTVNWTNPLDTPGASLIDLGTTYGTTQDLKFPYLATTQMGYDLINGTDNNVDYNLSKIKLYDMLSTHDGGSVTLNQESSYLYQPNEHLIVIPADGFYKIKMEYSAQLLTTSALTAIQMVHEWNDATTAMTNTWHDEDVTFNPDFKITTPLEIQLVRNYDENVELIKGKYNIFIHDGYPDNATEMNQGRYTNYSNWYTCFPHEKLGGGWFTPNPTSVNAITPQYDLSAGIGYVPANGELMAYDPVVNSDFICGFSSMGNKEGGGTAAIIKNGYSWSKEESDIFYNFYKQTGYTKLDYNYSTTPWSVVSTPSDFNQNEYIDAPQSYHTQYGSSMNGKIYCMVYLKKNDVLQLFGVHRRYEDTSGHSITYQTQAQVKLQIEAASPNSYAELIRRGYGYYTDPDFSRNLRVTNFLNMETKISEWVQNIIDAYNLEVTQTGKNVFINTKKKFNRDIPTAVDIDDRVNSADAEATRIDYPASMAVKYKIDTEEWGAENSVVEKYGQSAMNEPDWQKYIDSGYTVIALNDDAYVTSKSEKQLQFSYTWYDNFYFFGNNERSDNTTPVTLRLPVISKYSYMIDGYDYEESMKHDGYGLTQRFWFRPTATTSSVMTMTYPAESVQIYVPKNYQDTSLNLSYKTTEPSLLSQYFNITPYLASNYVEVEAYLSPEEYKMIKNGAMVHFDSDLYIPVSIEGFDPGGNNPTTLKMMKRI